MNKKTLSRKIFEVLNNLFMIFMIVIMLYPLIYVVNASLSDSNALISHKGPLWFPIKPSLNAYAMAFSNKLILTGYINTIVIVGIGTFVNILMTSMCAYPLSNKNLMLRGPVMKIIMLTMYFGGGLVQSYLLVRNLGMLDTRTALIIPCAINTYNMIILRAGFEGVPESIKESAMIDGAGHMTILFKIVFPLTKATIAVVCLYYAVEHWNSWFMASIYMQKDPDKWPLQLVLRQILMMNEVSAVSDLSMDQQNNVAESIKYATIVIATLPILCIYPFIQKYFEKGVMIGAVKG